MLTITYSVAAEAGEPAEATLPDLDPGC